MSQNNKKIDIKSSIKYSIKYSGLKVSVVFCVAFLLALGLSSFGSTVAHYRDREISSLNRFVSPPLSFDVLIDGQETAQVDLTSGEVVLTPTMTPHPGSAPIQYWVSAQVVGGDLDLCNAIDLFGTFPFPYNNRLNLLQTSTTSQTGAWTNTYSIFDGPENHANTFCTVDLIYRGSTDGIPFGEGYTDTQVVTVTFNVGEQIVNRVNSVDVVNTVLETETTKETQVENTEEEEVVESEETVEEETETVETPEEVSLPEETEESTQETPVEVVEETTTTQTETE